MVGNLDCRVPSERCAACRARCVKGLGRRLRPGNVGYSGIFWDILGYMEPYVFSEESSQTEGRRHAHPRIKSSPGCVETVRVPRVGVRAALLSVYNYKKAGSRV